MKRKQLFNNDEIDLMVNLLSERSEYIYDLYKLDEIPAEEDAYWSSMIYSLIDRLEAMKYD